MSDIGLHKLIHCAVGQPVSQKFTSCIVFYFFRFCDYCGYIISHRRCQPLFLEQTLYSIVVENTYDAGLSHFYHSRCRIDQPILPTCGGMCQTAVRLATEPVAAVGATYRDLFLDVRSFDHVTRLHLGLISDIARKSLPAISRSTGADPLPCLSRLTLRRSWISIPNTVGGDNILCR